MAEAVAASAVGLSGIATTCWGCRRLCVRRCQLRLQRRQTHGQTANATHRCILPLSTTMAPRTKHRPLSATGRTHSNTSLHKSTDAVRLAGLTTIKAANPRDSLAKAKKHSVITLLLLSPTPLMPPSLLPQASLLNVWPPAPAFIEPVRPVSTRPTNSRP